VRTDRSRRCRRRKSGSRPAARQPGARARRPCHRPAGRRLRRLCRKAPRQGRRSTPPEDKTRRLLHESYVLHPRSIPLPEPPAGPVRKPHPSPAFHRRLRPRRALRLPALSLLDWTHRPENCRNSTARPPSTNRLETWAESAKTKGRSASPALITLYAFTNGYDGSQPFGPVTIGSGGAFYGTARQGGEYNAGVFFSLAPPESQGGAWTYTTLHNFTGSLQGGPDGDMPSGNLVIGTGWSGGVYALGTAFSLTPPAMPGGVWTYALLHDFNPRFLQAARGPSTYSTTSPRCRSSFRKVNVRRGADCSVRRRGDRSRWHAVRHNHRHTVRLPGLWRRFLVHALVTGCGCRPSRMRLSTARC